LTTVAIIGTTKIGNQGKVNKLENFEESANFLTTKERIADRSPQ
jgi:hypothetical protein